MAKRLFLYTSTFPFETGETFLEHEIPILAKAFDSITIVSNSTGDIQTRELPAHCSAIQFSYDLPFFQKILSVFGVFSKLFWKELSIIRATYAKPITTLKIRTALQSLRKAQIWESVLAAMISETTTEYDEVYLYSYWNNDMAFALAYMHKPQQVKKCITRAHGWDVYFEVNQAQYLPYRTYIFEFLNSVYFISNKGKQYYTELFPHLESKMNVSYLGVPQQKVHVKKTDKRFCLISCSNIIPVKQIHKIVEALACIETTTIQWTHFGEGSVRSKIEELCNEKLKNNPHISYTLAGQKSNADILNFYSQTYVDAFINTSSSEGIPVSMMEAMSFGIPVIGTNVGGVAEIIEHTQNGYLLPAQPTQEEVAEAIRWLCSLPEQEIRTLRSNAYHTWNTKFNAENNYRAFVESIVTE